MSASREIHYIAPDLIVCDLETRQRQRNLDLSDIIPSIRKFGILHPILLDRDHNLLAGWRRWSTAKFLALETVPFRYMDSLSPAEKKIVELDENLRRTDLVWQDKALAFLSCHRELANDNPEQEWSVEATANFLGYDRKHVDKMLDLAEAIEAGDESVSKADTIANATTILSRRRQRATDETLQRILDVEQKPVRGPLAAGEGGRSGDNSGVRSAGDQQSVLGSGGTAEGSAGGDSADGAERPPVYSILHANAHEWLATYSDQRFNFLHCDLPYGVELNAQAGQDNFEGGGYDSNPDIYWALCDSIVKNWDNFMYPSAHCMFWISMKFYTDTVAFFEEHLGDRNLRVNPTPLIWHKTDNRGILSDPNRGPRNIYEAALMFSTGDRKIVKPVANVYGCPTSKAQTIHTNEKPVPMLKHFFQMFVDGHSRVLDPTCGSGSSVRSAEALGAESAVGLEFNADFAARANSRLLADRGLAALSATVTAAEKQEATSIPSSIDTLSEA